MNAASRLGALLESPGIVTAPGVYDALGALIAWQTGFPAVYLSGASIAYTRLGRPDLGLTNLSEVAAVLGDIRERVDIPVLVDADTGFGNALNVQRTMRLLERQGAAAVQIEDQVYPKRCGHLAGKALISAEEMVGKIHAALDARLNDATLLIARTDAVAVEGLPGALERGERYTEAGCDVLFVEAPRSPSEMAILCQHFHGRIPLLANMVEGGQTPSLTAAELASLGFSLVIFPGGLVRAVSRLMQDYFQSLMVHGCNRPLVSRMLDFGQLQELLGTQELLDLDSRYGGQGPARDRDSDDDCDGA